MSTARLGLHAQLRAHPEVFRKLLSRFHSAWYGPKPLEAQTSRGFDDDVMPAGAHGEGSAETNSGDRRRHASREGEGVRRRGVLLPHQGGRVERPASHRRLSRIHEDCQVTPPICTRFRPSYEHEPSFEATFGSPGVEIVNRSGALAVFFSFFFYP